MCFVADQASCACLASSMIRHAVTRSSTKVGINNLHSPQECSLLIQGHPQSYISLQEWSNNSINDTHRSTCMNVSSTFLIQ